MPPLRVSSLWFKTQSSTPSRVPPPVSFKKPADLAEKRQDCIRKLLGVKQKWEDVGLVAFQKEGKGPVKTIDMKSVISFAPF
jgi:hypothetical protein